MRRLFLCLGLALYCSTSVFAQGTLSALYLVAPKTTFIYGEPLKLTVRARDNAGVELTTPTLSWTVEPPSVATVAQDGTVTARQLATFLIRAQAGNVQAEIVLQVLPKNIVVTPQRDVMSVGTTQVIVAEAMDVNDRPIPGITFKWGLSNLLRGWDNSNPMATVDGAGQLKALVQGRMLIAATVEYQAIPSFLNQARGETMVEMRAPLTYQFGRIFAAEAAGGTSLLEPRVAHLIPAGNDGFLFAASLNSTGLSLLRWQNGTLRPLLSEGRPHITTGQPLFDIVAYAANHNGDVMTSELDSNSQTQVSYGPSESQTPLMVPGTPLYIADKTTRFEIQRNSLSDTGINVVLVNYNEVDSLRAATGLFRGTGKGLSEKIISTLDRLPGFPSDPFTFRYYGVTAEGTAWFTTTIGADGSKYALWKQSPYGPVERVLGDADAFQGSTIRNIGATGSSGTSQGFFVANNGDVVTTVNTPLASFFARWGNGAAVPEVLRGTVSGIYWHEPGVGTLINANINNRGNGLYVWTSGASPILLVGATLDGSAVTEIQSAVATPNGTIYAMVATANNPMLIVRLNPDTKVLLRSGEQVPVSVPPVVSALIKGLRPGLPLVITGGQTASIAEVQANGTLLSIIPVGKVLPGAKTFKGSNSNQVRSLATGEIMFADSNGLFRWNNGNVTVALTNPTTVEGVNLTNPANFDANSRGDLALQFNNAPAGIYRMAAGVVTKLLRIGETFNGGTVSALRAPAIDDSGRIAFYVVTEKGEYLALWSQGTFKSILSDGDTLPDGRVVRSHNTTILSANDGFVITLNLTDGQNTLLRYRSAFEYVINKNDKAPTGAVVQSTSTWFANRANGTAFFYNGANGNSHLVAKRGNTLYEIQDWGERTPEQDQLVSITSLYMTADGAVFALATDDTGQQLIYRGSPINGSVEVPFTARSFGGLSMATVGAGSAVSIGYSTLDARTSLPALAIFGYRQGGVLVSEAAVPASQAITSGRIYAEIGGAVNTGIAIANPNEQIATLTYYFTRTDGSQFQAGSLTLAAGRQTAAFLDQAPFNGGSNFAGTLTFTSNIPVAVIALRGYTNARSEFLITTLPVINLSQTAPTTATVIPHFAAGGGWATQILLVNPTNSTLSGTLQFYNAGSATTAGAPVSVTAGSQNNSSFTYTIQPKASLKLVASSGATLTSGSVKVNPGAGQSTPSALAVFSFTTGNTVVSEAGAAGVQGEAMQMYAEASGTPFSIGSIQTGVAIANPLNVSVNVTLDLRKLDGSSAGISPFTITVPANGQIAKFLNEFFPNLALPFQGVLRITGSAAVSVAGLRGRVNERNDFLITTTSPSPIVSSSVSSSLVFPHLVDGGGYTTQIIVVGNGSGDITGTLQFFGQSGLPLPLNFR